MQQPAQSAAYQGIISAYRSGHFDEAVQGALALRQDDLDELGVYWSRHFEDSSGNDPRSLSAAILHTECAFFSYNNAEPERGKRHFELAHRLIEGAVSGQPEVARRWYLASAVFFHSHGYHDAADDILRRGLARFRDDVPLLVERASFEETRANRPALNPLQFEAARAHRDSRLREAQKYLEDALRIAPETLEARLRLGRVLGERGRLLQAADVLGDLLNSSAPPPMRYLAGLFLGGIQERRAEYEAAAESYGAAMEAYPVAQAARTALAQVLHRLGRSDEALQIVRRSLSVEFQHGVADPWWAYQLSQLQSFDAVLSALRADARR